MNHLTVLPLWAVQTGFMKNRTVLTALLAATALGVLPARAQVAPSTTVPVKTAAERGIFPSTSNLPNAFSADKLSFNLVGFGRVGFYSDTSGAGRPLLLLTSVNAAASAYEMRPLFLAYRGTRPVYVLEWPGFGSSDRPDVRYTPELMTRALEQMIDVIGSEVDGAAPNSSGIDVVALSLGSEFAARAALGSYSGPRVRSLALISPTGLSEAKSAADLAAEPQNSANLYRTLSSPLLSGALYGLLSTPPVIDLFLRRSFEGQPDPGLESYAAVSTRQPGAVYAPLYFISGLLRTPDAFAELYSKLSTPTLVLYDRDGFVNFTRLPDLLAAKANVKAVKVAPTRGLPQFEQLSQVTAALDAFWAAQK